MSKLPETLVLLATVHGRIQKDREFKIPYGIKVTRIMAARPGVCNVTTGRQLEQIAKDMITTFKDGVSSEEINTVVENIKPTVSGVVKKVEENIKTDKTGISGFQQFLRSHIKTPDVKTFLPGEMVLDKTLSRSSGEGLESAYDYKLTMINVPGNPDLFDEIIFGRTGPSIARQSASSSVRADLSIIVGNLRAAGVKHLVFFDFSCSVFEGKVEGRDERALRRDMIQRGVGKKTKSRKTRRSKSNPKWKRSSPFSRNTLRSRRS